MDAASIRSSKPGPCGFELAAPETVGLDPEALERLCRIIEAHIAENRYPGAQVAVARHGKLALARTFGVARLEPDLAPARDDTLWLLYSNTKVVTAAAVWVLVEQGALTFHDRIADHVPEFAQNGKGDITVLQVLTHQGGFPSASRWMIKAWEDHELLRKRVCKFTLDWTPGMQVHYHSLAAHWVLAVLIEAIAKVDFREFIRIEVIEKLGLGDELFVGLPDAQAHRAADMHEPSAKGDKQTKMQDENTPAFRRAGVPGGGGYGTARAMAAFYQALANGGAWNGARLVSPRMVQYVTRNFTEDRLDGYMGMPMHRGLGPHMRGATARIRGLGSIASPVTFGHGGVGSSYCWTDPQSGLSLAYLSNSRVPDPWHSRRLDIISSCVHAALTDV